MASKTGVAVLALALVALGTGAAPSPDAKIDTWLLGRLLERPRASFLVLFDSPASIWTVLETAAAAPDRRRAVFERLSARSRSTQDGVRRWLEHRGVAYRPLWVVNGLRVEGDLDLARALAVRPEVVRVVGDPRIWGLDSVREGSGRATDSIEWGIAAIEADRVWNEDGVHGEGVVVASADTGVEWTHPALREHYRGWDGQTASHDYNWHDAIADSAAPLDDHDHGTHTTGIMVGDDGDGNQIGVAPGARWIACRNMDHGVGQPSTYLECIQFFLAPWPHGGDPEFDGDPSRSPDIVNNSWTCPPEEGCDPDTLEAGFAALEAAGILAVSAASNEGPYCSSVNAPPAIYARNLVVGATDSSNHLAAFSSRGPVLVDGSGRLRPDLSAPGEGVRSSVRGGGYATFSGTSMASPHVAGAAALLWSARPELRGLIGLTRCLMTLATGPVSAQSLLQTCGGTNASDRPNNLFGWGLADAYRALHLDPDGDADGIADACDCAPADPGAFEPPGEVAGVGLGADRVTVSWTSMAPRAGTGTTYEVVRGDLSDLRATGSIGDALCLAGGLGDAFLDDYATPPSGHGFYFVVRAANACGDGGWGSTSAGTPRAHASCP